MLAFDLAPRGLFTRRVVLDFNVEILCAMWFHNVPNHLDWCIIHYAYVQLTCYKHDLSVPMWPFLWSEFYSRRWHMIGRELGDTDSNGKLASCLRSSLDFLMNRIHLMSNEKLVASCKALKEKLFLHRIAFFLNWAQLDWLYVSTESAKSML